jgi:putative hydrolase of the HAD superfamily
VSELRRRGKGVGLISNWDVRLEEVLADLGLLERFDWVVISAVVGVQKPDAAIFEHALRRCSLPAGRVIHVGDSYEDDVLGARRAGLRALWLRRDGPADAEDAIGSLEEVPAMLD